MHSDWFSWDCCCLLAYRSTCLPKMAEFQTFEIQAIPFHSHSASAFSFSSVCWFQFSLHSRQNVLAELRIRKLKLMQPNGMVILLMKLKLLLLAASIKWNQIKLQIYFNSNWMSSVSDFNKWIWLVDLIWAAISNFSRKGNRQPKMI